MAEPHDLSTPPRALSDLALWQCCTIHDVAQWFGIAYNSAYNLRALSQVSWRWASEREEQQLMTQAAGDVTGLLPRVVGLPPKSLGQRLKLFAKADIAALKREKRGKGQRGKDRRPRKKRVPEVSQ